MISIRMVNREKSSDCKTCKRNWTQKRELCSMKSKYTLPKILLMFTNSFNFLGKGGGNSVPTIVSKVFLLLHLSSQAFHFYAISHELNEEIIQIQWKSLRKNLYEDFESKGLLWIMRSLGLAAGAGILAEPL